MAEEILENQEPATWAKFPWQKSIIVLLLAVSTLFWLNEKNSRQEAISKDAALKESEKQRLAIQNKLNECQEGKTKFITDLFNNELALKLSKDTSAISKLIIQSLIKVNEQRVKENQNEKIR